jgi:hypothetical protein
MTPVTATPEQTDRERLAAELAADGGPDWASRYRPGSVGCHELLDRVSIIADMTERFLVEHPACIANPAWHELAERASGALHELYQQVGAEHLSADEGNAKRS